MTIWEIMRARHSVRQYLDTPIEPEKVLRLQAEIDKINRQNGLHFQLVLNEPEAFAGPAAHYGSFQGVANYMALIAPAGMEEQVGYFGEQLVLLAQGLGLNTCWVALTYNKKKVRALLQNGEQLYIVIALGYGATQGKPHISKPVTKIARVTIDTPQWFESGMDAVMLAPTAINQQKFYFEQVGERGVKVTRKNGPCSKIDLGIAKYHFTVGAGEENFDWIG